MSGVLIGGVYILTCDGKGCSQKYIGKPETPPRLPAVRHDARSQGWSTGSSDLCPKCTALLLRG